MHYLTLQQPEAPAARSATSQQMEDHALWTKRRCNLAEACVQIGDRAVLKRTPISQLQGGSQARADF